MSYEEGIEATRVQIRGFTLTSSEVSAVVGEFLDQVDTVYVLDKSDESAQWIVTAEGEVGRPVPLRPKEGA